MTTKTEAMLALLLAYYCCCCLGPLVSRAQLHESVTPTMATLATLNHHHLQQQLASKLQPTTQLPISARSQRDQTKVGLAPSDRPACQLPPILAQRRHAPESVDSSKNSLLHKLDPISPTVNSSLPMELNYAAATTTTSGQHHQRPTKSFDSSERLRQLRQLMQSNNYDAYLVTHYDEHGMEYVADYDRRLRFLSGFTGSNGHALVLMDKAVLFTDGRYALQADLDLDCNWSLVVDQDPSSQIAPWLKLNSPRGLKVTTDARLMPLGEFDMLDSQFKKQEMEFLLISQDLVDIVWNVASSQSGGNNGQSTSGSGNSGVQGEWFREPPREPLFVHPLQFAGNVSWQEKLVQVSDAMGKLKARHYIVSQLDDIAWLLNLRGDDIPMSPLFKSYLFISRAIEPAATNNNLQQPIFRSPQTTNSQVVASVEQLLMTASTGSSPQQQQIQAPQVVQVPSTQTIKVTMYVDLAKITRPVREHLQVDQANGTVLVTKSGDEIVTTRIQIELKDYDVFIMDLRDKLSPGPRQLQGKLLINSNANVAIHVLAKAYDDRLVLINSLVTNLKAVKSDGEVQGMRLAHWRDSLAISMLLSQLDHDIETRGQLNKWTETSAAKELKFYRSLMDYNRGESFNSISAYGPAAAIVHYSPSENEIKVIGNQSTFLLDTGGQYLDGTTDITRTVHFGEPSEFQRETYTRVLMGAIDLMSLIFEQSKFKLGDLMARRHLFELGLDYAHGTGHGIGLFSMVHESPWLLEHYTNSAAQLLAQTNKQQPNGQTPPAVMSDPIGIQANMFTSVEPGYYRANDFGIRLENIVVTQKVDLPWALARPNDRQETRQAMGTGQQQDGQPEVKQFLRFEPISLVPFEPKLIKFELLSNKQKAWLNSFNLMVRLRMTQQINYYLAKIRNMSSAPPQANHLFASPSLGAAQGSISSSRLYQTLNSRSPANESAANTNSNNNNNHNNNKEQSNMINLGYYNFLRMDGSKLQAKLEQTHKWIMTKTELIPLDVPQSLVRSTQQQSQQTFRDGQQATRSLGDNLDGQKLMLAYMSSLPFNDAEAGEAFSAINAARPPASSLSGRLDNNSSSTTASATSGDQHLARKCSGLECDLWLLQALNAPNYQQHQKTQNGHRQRAGWSQDSAAGFGGEDPADFSKPLGVSSFDQDAENSMVGSTFGSLMDLFKLNGSSGSSAGGINMWPVVVLSTFVVLQIGLLAYMCRGDSGHESESADESLRHPHNLLQRPRECPRSPASSLSGSTSRRHKAIQCGGSGHSCPLANMASSATTSAHHSESDATLTIPIGGGHQSADVAL